MKQRMTFIFDGEDDGTSKQTLSTMTKAQKDNLAVEVANILALALNTMCQAQDSEHDVHNNFTVESAEHLED